MLVIMEMENDKPSKDPIALIHDGHGGFYYVPIDTPNRDEVIRKIKRKRGGLRYNMDNEDPLGWG
jgi:hypothetical protein